MFEAAYSLPIMQAELLNSEFKTNYTHTNKNHVLTILHVDANRMGKSTLLEHGYV